MDLCLFGDGGGVFEVNDLFRMASFYKGIASLALL